MKFSFFISLLVLLSSANALAFPKTPNPEISPGRLCSTSDPDFQKFRYHGRVAYCKRNVSSGLKKEIKAQYDISPGDFNDYIIDHIIPLSIGGSNHPENLWPQHKCIQHSQGDWEASLYENVKSGRFGQQQAVQYIMNTKYRENIPLRGCN